MQLDREEFKDIVIMKWIRQLGLNDVQWVIRANLTQFDFAVAAINILILFYIVKTMQENHILSSKATGRIQCM